MQGNNRYFRRKKNGMVKDPFHPNKQAAKLVYEYKSPEICQAVADAFMPKLVTDGAMEGEVSESGAEIVPFEEAMLRE